MKSVSMASGSFAWRPLITKKLKAPLFLLILFSPAFAEKNVHELNPTTPYEKFLITKVDLAKKIIESAPKGEFPNLYKNYYSKFKDFISIDYFTREVLGNHYEKFSKNELEAFENTYFAYILLLIKRLKDPFEKRGSTLSFYTEKQADPLLVPVGVKIAVSDGVNKQNFKLIFLMEKKTKALKNTIFKNENILNSHKKQFDASLKKLGVKKFLLQFEESTLKEFEKR